MKIEDFELRSVKMNSDGKVNTKYDEIVTTGEVSYGKSYDVTDKLIPHKDYTNALMELAGYVAIACDLKINIPGLSAAAQKVVDKENVRIIESITVTGVSLQGDDENRSVVITAKREVRGADGSRFTEQAINSPKISLNGDTFGIEPGVAKAINLIIQEAFEYAVNGKAINPRLDIAA